MKQFMLGIVIGSVLTGAGVFAFDYSRDAYGQRMPSALELQQQFELGQQQHDRVQRRAQEAGQYNPCD